MSDWYMNGSLFLKKIGICMSLLSNSNSAAAHPYQNQTWVPLRITDQFWACWGNLYGFNPGGGGVLDFGLDGGVPPGPRDPNPCLEVKKVPMFRDFAPKMDPCLGIFWKRAQKIFVILTKNLPMFRDLGGQKWDPCLGIFCQKPTHLGGTSPYSVSMEVPPRGFNVVFHHKSL